MSDDKERQGKTASKRVAVETENRRDRETTKGRSQTWRYSYRLEMRPLDGSGPNADWRANPSVNSNRDWWATAWEQFYTRGQPPLAG